METRKVKWALKVMPIKADRRDAEGIARLFHLGWFRPVHCKSILAQEVRALRSARKPVHQGMIVMELLPRGLLRNFGVNLRTISKGRFDPASESSRMVMRCWRPRRVQCCSPEPDFARSL